jgi:hypothetical protein
MKSTDQHGLQGVVSSQCVRLTLCDRSRGVLHRNIKPKHLLIRPGPNPQDTIIIIIIMMMIIIIIIITIIIIIIRVPTLKTCCGASKCRAIDVCPTAVAACCTGISSPSTFSSARGPTLRTHSTGPSSR